jgi:hypothetical protein
MMKVTAGNWWEEEAEAAILSAYQSTSGMDLN